ncbi:acyl-[acyl-carrier-protein] thioesterase [Saccharicrinis aurantiacus]|uniref:acyl-[acyl-carrier-protein] thioesterase n=1 Tax=Saccharicrinis aurantiacus TaxID=1849719 RepID=UPI00095033C7|nr:acyl-ACP thioesterase domain-containing protein [Saccharicrinis aurantiacus]
MSNIYTKEFEVSTYDVDINQNIRISRIFAFFQEVAWLHAEELQFGFFHLKENHNSFWALSRLHINVNKYPKWNDKVTLRTWTVSANRLFARRDFEVILNDTVCAKGSSDWIIADLESRVLQDPSKILATIPYVFGEGLSEVSTERIKPTKLSLKDECIRKVRYNDLDMNNHLNSIRYLDWVLDCLPRDWHINNKVTNVSINYMHEVACEQEVRINYTQIKEAACTYQFIGINKNTNINSFLMEVSFEKILL